MLKYIIFICLIFVGCDYKDTANKEEKVKGKIYCYNGIINCDFVSINSTDGTMDAAYPRTTYTVVCDNGQIFVAPINNCYLEFYND